MAVVVDEANWQRSHLHPRVGHRVVGEHVAAEARMALAQFLHPVRERAIVATQHQDVGLPPGHGRRRHDRARHGGPRDPPGRRAPRPRIREVGPACSAVGCRLERRATEHVQGARVSDHDREDASGRGDGRQRVPSARKPLEVECPDLSGGRGRLWRHLAADDVHRSVEDGAARHGRRRRQRGQRHADQASVATGQPEGLGRMAVAVGPAGDDEVVTRLGHGSVGEGTRHEPLREGHPA